MPTDFHFRFSTCITLVLACAGLGYSEWDLVAGVGLFTVLVIGLIIAAFVWDHRIKLGHRLANLLGLGIAIAAVGWLIVQVGSEPDGFTNILIQPGLMLPYVGPFLMALIPAKLFRPKHLGDWWTMQGIGLAGIALGASMSETEIFAAILVLYSCSALWSVSILYLRTASGQVDPIPSKKKIEAHPIAIPTANTRFSVRPLMRLLAWTTLIAFLFSLPLFLLTPRSTATPWAFGKQRMETGFTLENSHDINKVGNLGVNHEIALRVVATESDGQPKMFLETDSLWRGISYSDYEDGKWVRRTFPSSISAVIRAGQFPLETPPPDLGPGTFQLEFQPAEASSGFIISSPPRWKIGGDSPVRSIRRGEQASWLPLYDGSFAPNGFNRRLVTYRQWTRPLDEPGLGEAFELSATQQFPRVHVVLTTARVAVVRDWAADRLKKLVGEGKLPKDVLADAESRTGVEVQPKHYEAVARAFTEYFSTSPEFTYTLKLRRQDRKLDLIEDFLLNTKAGHCQWFASALCMTLRAVGIPAQFVMGFKGQEAQEDGSYVIRQENAHAWVEVLIPRKAPAGFPYQDAENAKEQIVWHWLSLDPTPAAGAANANTSWFDTSSLHAAIASLLEFVLKYDADKRKVVAEAAPLRFLQISGFFLALGLLVFAIRKIRKQFAKSNGDSSHDGGNVLLPWYQELTRVLNRYGIEPVRGQTPKEFAERAGAKLRESHAEVAGIPAFVISKLYRVRFAGLTLNDQEIADIESAIHELDYCVNS